MHKQMLYPFAAGAPVPSRRRPRGSAACHAGRRPGMAAAGTTSQAAVGADGMPLRYMPAARPGDPVSDAAVAVTGGTSVARLELLDSRWNGNEALRYDVEGVGTSGDGEESGEMLRPVFAKLNRVEHPQVFMAEAVSLTTLISAAPTVVAPRPLHIGRLPLVGDYGPGAFMLLQWFDLVPFGASRAEVQRELGDMIADIHTSAALDHVHRGRFGFGVNNFLALTPMDNTWTDSWSEFFARRLQAQVDAAFKDKVYGRAPLDPKKEEDAALTAMASRIIASIDAYFAECTVTPSLLHGDLWIGNVGATRDSSPVVYDPASFFGHSEFDLALMHMFGGYTDNFWDVYFARVPKAPGFEIRTHLYEMYQYLNQLNLFGDPQVRTKVIEHAQTLIDYLD